jgi:putative N6-adenine-specific DNA methylase
VSTRLDAFVVAAPGLEQLVADELVRLGVRPANPTHGGVNCSLTWPQLWAVHLRSRIATRVLVRVARFKADGFDTLATGLSRVDWNAWLPEGGVAVRAAADGKSGLFHTGAVEERVAAAIGRDVGEQEVLVRVARDVVTVSIDATGPALHKRGYRGPAGKAPLRETLAAAVLVAAGWEPQRPLLDPFCGSGTLLVEAALIARRMAPGRNRPFQFMQWPSFDADRWERLCKGADSDVVDRCPPLLGSDRDAGAVAASTANAASAGVGDAVTVECRSVSDLEVPRQQGWVVTNPPYGERVGGADVRDLYARFGAVLRERAQGWGVAVLASERTPVAQMQLPLVPVLATSNGGIPVGLHTVPRNLSSVGRG